MQNKEHVQGTWFYGLECENPHHFFECLVRGEFWIQRCTVGSLYSFVYPLDLCPREMILQFHRVHTIFNQSFPNMICWSHEFKSFKESYQSNFQLDHHSVFEMHLINQDPREKTGKHLLQAFAKMFLIQYQEKTNRT